MVYRDGEPVVGNFPEPDIIFSVIAQKMFDAIHPVGEQYVQYPSIPDIGGVQRNTVDPMTLYNVNGITSTWVELNYDGAFFRANGGLSDNFGSQSVPQSSQLPNIKGETDMGIFTQGGRGSKIGAIDMTSNQGTRASISSGSYDTKYLKFNANDSDTTYVDGGEVRPANYTVRIWQRTA